MKPPDETVAQPDDTAEIVGSGRAFADVPEWAADAVSFSSARGLFSGTGENAFSPDMNMTYAMLVTVLARLDGEDTGGGAAWYEKGMSWAAVNGVGDGSDPNSDISCEQFMTMLWRYSGSPASGGSLDGFADAGSVSGYAKDAMLWAVENKLVSGSDSGRLNPRSNVTRAQAAQILKDFIQK